MDPLTFVLAVVGAAAVAAVAVLMAMRVRPPAGLDAELARARDEAAEARRQLAVEAERTSRIAPLEQALAEKTGQIDRLREEKADVDRRLAAVTEGLARLEATLKDTRTRLSDTEQERDELRRGLAEARDAAGRLEQSLATRTEAVGRLEAVETDLRERLAGVIRQAGEAAEKAGALLREKAALESGNAEKAALLTEKTDASERLRIRLEQAETALHVSRETVASHQAELAGLRADLDQERRAAEEKLRLLTEAKEQMTQEFRLLANTVMQTHGETFSKQNKEQIDAILAPLREKLTEFQQGLQTAQVETTRERAGLAEQIRQLSENSAKMTSETNNLARALRGEARTQGAWGEMILASILEKSGLRDGEEYIKQQSMEGEDGQRLRPDVIVNLPDSKTIVIDSKVSLVAFDAFVNANDDAERGSALSRHLVSMRTHIRTLSGKDYHTAAGSHVDYVFMFVPIEGALAAALTEDPALTAFAIENNVAIATPTTLMMMLRTVANIWQVERRNRNAEAIAQRAGLLYDKLVGFVGDMGAIETSLNRAQKSYSDAMGKLSTGGGNLIRQAEQLKELGAKTRRSLPVSLTGDDKADLLAEPVNTAVEAE